MSMVVKNELSQVEQIKQKFRKPEWGTFSLDLAKPHFPRTYLSGIEKKVGLSEFLKFLKKSSYLGLCGLHNHIWGGVKLLKLVYKRVDIFCYNGFSM